MAELTMNVPVVVPKVAAGNQCSPTPGDDNMFTEAEQDDGLLTDESKPEFVYENLTLDEIIQLMRSEDENGKPARHVSDVIKYGTDDTRPGEGGDKPSPVYILKLLSETGKLFEMEAKELEVGTSKMSDFRVHRWRVIWTHQDVQGIAEAPRKMMAKQVAAYDLIYKLENRFPDYNIPDCKIPPGCLISPYLFILLDQKCAQMNIAPADFQHQVNISSAGKKLHGTICFLRDEMFVGRSYYALYAKRFAVKKAYESLIGRRYPDDPIIFGDKCFRDKDEKYYPIESEANHVYYLYEKGSSKKQPRLDHGLRGGLSTSMKTHLRPARLRPPPVNMPEGLRLKLKRLDEERARKPKLELVVDTESLRKAAQEARACSDTTIVVECPYKYGELDDDDEELADWNVEVVIAGTQG